MYPPNPALPSGLLLKALGHYGSCAQMLSPRSGTKPVWHKSGVVTATMPAAGMQPASSLPQDRAMTRRYREPGSAVIQTPVQSFQKEGSEGVGRC